MSFRWPLVAAALGFLLTLIARLPLQWIIGQLPAGIACDQPLGTLWRGSCAALRLPWINLGTARWHLHAGSLLRGRLQAQVDTNRSVLQFSGIVSLGLSGEIRLVDADLRYTLGSALFAQLPPLSGDVTARFDELRSSARKITAVTGWLEARDLAQLNNRAPLGSYRIEFSAPAEPDGSIPGAVRDLGGPLEVQGSLRLTPAPGYLLQGTVAARPSASEALVRQIAFLGSPDAAGRRGFSQEASF